MTVPKTFLEWKFYGMDLILNPFPEPCRVVKDFMLSACRDVSEYQAKRVRFRTITWRYIVSTEQQNNKNHGVA